MLELENAMMDGQVFDHIDNLGFQAQSPESGWSSKKKLYELLWAIQNELKDSPEFEEENDWVKGRKETLGIK